MSPLVLLIGNATTFTFLSILYWRGHRHFNAGTFLLLFYSVCAWGAVAYHEHSWYSSFRGTETFSASAFIYLIVVIIIFAYPILRFDTGKLEKAMLLDEQKVYYFTLISIAIQIILYITLLPAVLASVKTTDIGDFREGIYEEGEVVRYPFYALNILDRLYMGARNVMVIISIYFLIFMKGHRLLYRFFFLSSFFFPIYHFVAFASRAVMITQFLFGVFLLCMVILFLSRRQVVKILRYAAVAMIPIVSYVTYVSNSRFGELASYMYYRYLGESFNNYNAGLYGHLKGNTWGQAYFTFFSKLFGQSINFKTTREKWEYLDNATGVDTHVFYTFVGGLNIEFGYVFTVVLGILLAMLIIRATRDTCALSLPSMIVLGMLGYTMINGAFFFVLQGDWGNLEILFTVFFYYLMKHCSIQKYRTILYR